MMPILPLVGALLLVAIGTTTGCWMWRRKAARTARARVTTEARATR